MDRSIGAATLLIEPPDVYVRLRGELDYGTAPGMTTQFSDAVAAGCRDFWVDLADVSFCDASTVRLLLGLQRQVTVLGGSVTLVEPSRCVRRVFEIVGLDGMLDGATEPAL